MRDETRYDPVPSDLLEYAYPRPGEMRRTKIIATIGPASRDESTIRALVAAGADVFRINFSHGSSSEKTEIVRTIRKVATETGRYIPVMGDIQGPKIRVGEVDGVVELVRGSEFVITTGMVPGNASVVSTSFAPILTEVRPGHRIFINDGLIELVVRAVEGDRVATEVRHGGPLSSRKGMNFPDTELKIPSITDKDREDLKLAAVLCLDYIAASFVRRKEDIEEIRAILQSHGAAECGVVAKLEMKQAVEALDSILEVSDGVMVARGDLGVELPPESVPVIQKRVIEWATNRGRFAITATQMLESMTASSRPTRAEASDVANAIFDGSDAVMLSAETASGSYPVKAVEMMARIALVAERNRSLHGARGRDPVHESYETDDATDALANAARHAANDLGARYIVCFTQTGFAARLMSKFRPSSPIIAFTNWTWVARRMNVLWGVEPIVLRDVGDYHEQIVDRVEHFLLERGMVEEGDRLVIMMGSPIYHRAKTNVIRIHRVGGGTL